MRSRPPRRQTIQVLGERFEAGEVVHGKKVVDEGQSGLHASRHRAIVRRPEQRVQPDQTVAASLQPGDLRSQPSEINSTTGPLLITRLAQRTLKVRSASPIRVPPPQSGSCQGMRCIELATFLATSSRVTRVKRVANRNVSTRPGRCDRPWTKYSSRRE